MTTIQQVIPAGEWVAVERYPVNNNYTITPLVGWALCTDPGDGSQRMRGLEAVGPGGVELVADRSEAAAREFFGYFPSADVAITEIRRSRQPGDPMTTLHMPGGKTTTYPAVPFDDAVSTAPPRPTRRS